MTSPARTRRVRWIATAVAIAPVAISVLIAVARGEWLAGDRSIMGLFTHDVFSPNPPLLGTVSTLGNYTEGGTAVHHLGPAQFYVLAPVDWLAGGHPAGLLLGGLMVNVIAIAVAVWAAQRRLGDLGAAAIALLAVGVSFGLGPALLRDIWTPHLGLWPVFALFALTWSLLDGDVAALPWAAAMASFLAQIELLFVGPTLVAVVVGVVGLGLHRWRHRHEPQARLWPAVLASAAVSAVLWLPVGLQEATGDPGNLQLLLDSLGGQEARAGWGFVWRNLVALLQLPPLWLRRTSGPFEIGTDEGPLEVAVALALLAALAVLTARARARRHEQPAVAALLATAWAVLLGAALNLAIIPADGTIGLQYRRWMWPASAFVWFAVAVAVVVELEALRARTAAIDEGGAPAPGDPVDEARPLPAGAAAFGLLALAVAACVPASIGQHTPLPDDLATNEVVESAWDPFLERLPRQPTYVQLAGAKAAFAVGPEVIRRLAVHGFDVAVPDGFADSFGDHRVLDPERPPPQTVAIISDEGTLAPPSTPVAVLAGGRIDGRSGERFTAEVAPLMARVRTSGPFTVDDAGRLLLAEPFVDGPIDPDARVAALLADPARAMFDEAVLEQQLAGRTTSSPLTDDEARWLLDELRDLRVVLYLLPAVEPAAP